jgi:hypothetical protein
LLSLRETLSAPQLAAYDSLRVCYAILTGRVLALLPQSYDGVWLQPTPQDPTQQTVMLFRSVFADSHFNTPSCPASPPARV